jgi:hypothetical protein
MGLFTLPLPRSIQGAKRVERISNHPSSSSIEFRKRFFYLWAKTIIEERSTFKNTIKFTTPCIIPIYVTNLSSHMRLQELQETKIRNILSYICGL